MDSVTFTNKAANEMKHRLIALVGSKIVDRLVIGTLSVPVGVCIACQIMKERLTGPCRIGRCGGQS